MFINTKAFFPMDFILQNGLPDLVTSRNSERENQHLLIGSLLLRLHDSIVSLPVLMLAVAAAMVLAGLSDKVVREKSSGVLWPKNHGKRYGSKMIQNYRSFPGFHSKADGKIRIMINLPGVHSVLHSRVAGNHNGHPTTYGNWCFHSFLYFSEVARCTKSWRCQRTSSPRTRAMASGSVQFLPSYWWRIMIEREFIIFYPRKMVAYLDLTKLPTQRWVI